MANDHTAVATRDERRRLATERLLAPGPHPVTGRTLGGLLLAALVIAAAWVASMSTYSEEPAVVTPAPIRGVGVQATVQATTFTQSTSILTLRLSLKATGGLVDRRGTLRSDLDVRVVDDAGVRMIRLVKGDPLAAQEIALEMDGDVNRFPFDHYKGDFSVLVEEVGAGGTLTPIPLSIGTAHAETGWFTRYEVDRTAAAESKVTIVAMQREPFIRAFAVLLAVLMLIVAVMAMTVGVMCFTNRRASDAGIVGWQVALLFALPFVRRVMPGDPPIGCALDVAVFAWSILLCVLAMVVTMIAWIRQSNATLKADRKGRAEAA